MSFDDKITYDAKNGTPTSFSNQTSFVSFLNNACTKFDIIWPNFYVLDQIIH